MSKVYLLGISLLLVQGMVLGNDPEKDREGAHLMMHFLENPSQFQLQIDPKKNKGGGNERVRVSVKGAKKYQSNIAKILKWKRDYRNIGIDKLIKKWRKSDLVEHINNTPLNDDGAKLTHILTKEGLAKSLTGVCKLPGVNLWVEDNNGLRLEEYSKMPNSNHKIHSMCLYVVQTARAERKKKFNAMI